MSDLLENTVVEVTAPALPVKSSLAVCTISNDSTILKRWVEHIARHSPNHAVHVQDGNVKPFIFAKEANNVLRTAFSDNSIDSVILCNQDAMLLTDDGFENMRLEAQRQGYDIMSPLIKGRVGAAWQSAAIAPTAFVPRRGEISLDAWNNNLAFVCVYISRHAWETLGAFDERFIGYGYEDNDYCRRAVLCGMRIGVYHGCVLSHDEEDRQFVKNAHFFRSFIDNKVRFERKWAVNPTPLLSVLIPTLDTERRVKCFKQLMEQLRGQQGRLARPSDVEIISLCDNKRYTVGTKRNHLVNNAVGRYVIFVDDDDRVAHNYLDIIVNCIYNEDLQDALKDRRMNTEYKGATTISFKGRLFQRGVYAGVIDYDSSFAGVQKNLPGQYLRWPNHICAVRRDLAIKCRFPDINKQEDRAFAEALHAFDTHPIKINEQLYDYMFDERYTETQR